jgi:hypothetical protein
MMERFDPYDRDPNQISYREEFLLPISNTSAGIFTGTVTNTGAASQLGTGGGVIQTTGTNAAGAHLLTHNYLNLHGNAVLRMKWRANMNAAVASGQNWSFVMGFQQSGSTAGHYFQQVMTGTSPVMQAVSTDGSTPVTDTLSSMAFITGAYDFEIVCDATNIYFYYGPVATTGAVLVATHAASAMGGVAQFVGAWPTFKVTKTLGSTAMGITYYFVAERLG